MRTEPSSVGETAHTVLDLVFCSHFPRFFHDLTEFIIREQTFDPHRFLTIVLIFLHSELNEALVSVVDTN